VILSIIGIIFFFLVVGAIGCLKQIKVGPLLDLVKIQRALILDIEEEAQNYGNADPLAFLILNKIRDARKKENSK